MTPRSVAVGLVLLAVPPLPPPRRRPPRVGGPRLPPALPRPRRRRPRRPPARRLEQAACTHWAQDDRAFAAVFTATENFLGCAHDAGLVTLSESLTTADDRLLATYPITPCPAR